MDQEWLWYRARSSRQLGRAIQTMRKEKSLTQVELAARVGVGRMTIVRLEAGEPISFVTVWSVLEELGYEAIAVPRFAEVAVTPRESS